MPHMSNLPWINTYCFLFCSIVLVMSSFSLPTLMKTTKNNAKNMKILKKFKWMW